MSERADVLLVGRALISHDSDLLLVQRSYDDSRNAGQWEFPGGKIDAGEEIAEGLIREVYEETGLGVEPYPSLVYVENEIIKGGKYDGRLYRSLFYRARWLMGDVRMSDEHEGFIWLSHKNALDLSLTEESRRALLAIN